MTVALSDNDRLLVAALESYLAANVCQAWGSVRIEGFERSGGGLSWETHFADLRGPAGEKARVVVKRPPSSGPLAPYDISREATLLTELSRHSRVPVPRLLACETDGSILGRPFSVMEFVPGEIPLLRKIEHWSQWSDAGRRQLVGQEMMDLLGQLQEFDWRPLAVGPVLGGELSAAEQVRRHIDRLMDRVDEHVTSKWIAQPVLRDAWCWLHENLQDSPPGDVVVVHGDFRVGNVIWDGPKVAALLDWERATLGDPMVDLGFFCMPLARQPRPDLMGMLLPFDQMCSLYRAATGRSVDVPRLHYYVAYWQFVELAQVTRALVFSTEEAPKGEVRHVTSYPLLSIAAAQLLDLIDRYEKGHHEL